MENKNAQTNQVDAESVANDIEQNAAVVETEENADWASDLISADGQEGGEEVSMDQASGIRRELERRGELEPTIKSGAGIFENFDNEKGSADNGEININLLIDIPVEVSVEIGRTTLPIKSILQLAPGSVVELDGVAGEPMTVLVNGQIIAKGEVVVVNDKFGVRLTDVIDPNTRMKQFRK